MFLFHFRYNIQQCGGTITEDLSEIRSPIQEGNGYMHNLNCTWVIQAPEGKVIELKQVLFNVYFALFN